MWNTNAVFTFKNVPFILTVAVVLLAGVATGSLMHGWLIKIKLKHLLTLVTQNIVNDLHLLSVMVNGIDHNKAYLTIGKARFLTIPVSVWLMILAFVVFGFILAKTKFGRSVYAIGGSQEAARLAGLNPQKIVTSCFVIIGALTALGGIVFSSRMNSGQPAANINLEFDAITAVILGGVSFAGGVGDMFGTILGVILIQAFNTGLIMVNVSTFWQYVARGALLLFALTSDFIRKQKREKELLEASMKNIK